MLVFIGWISNSMVCWFMCGITEVDRRQQGKNKCLKECNKQFKAIHENHKQGGKNTHSCTSSNRLTSIAEDENQTGKG